MSGPLECASAPFVQGLQRKWWNACLHTMHPQQQLQQQQQENASPCHLLLLLRVLRVLLLRQVLPGP